MAFLKQCLYPFMKENKFLSLFRKICESKKYGKLFILPFVFLSMILLFLAGVTNSSAKNEQTAEYISEVVLNHTVSKQYLGLAVESKDIEKKQVNDSVAEFRLLYGIFKETNASYISSINADKSHTIYFKNIDDDTNYSFLNNDHGFSTPEYKGHYKTEVYPLELMFVGTHLYGEEREELPESKIYTNFIYISQTHADKLLEKDGLEPNEENYRNLLGRYVNLEIDGVDYYFWIEDIYLETNYFYDAVTEIMGGFFMCGGHPRSLAKQAVFFLKKYSFQNKYYLEYSTTSYSTKDYKYTLLTHNIVDGFELDSSKIFINSNANDFGSIVLLALAIIILISLLTTIFFTKYRYTVIDHIEIAAVLFAPYIVFWLIHLVTNNILLFSSFYTLWTFGTIVVFVILYSVIMLAKKHIINKNPR